MKEIIEFFTKEGELVFDYFMGVGGTLIGASLSNRRAIGVDLSADFISIYKEANSSLGLKEQRTIQADAMKLLREPEQLLKMLAGEKFSLIAIDPPYGDMMNREKTGEAAKKKQDTAPTPFTELAEDLGNLQIEEFYSIFKKSVEDALPHLKHKGHVVVFIKDLQPDKQNTNLLHARVIEDLNSLEGLQYLGTKIWADQSVNLYPYGYPYAYVANQIHQYIMIFRKSGE
jgi:tRNA G10  N-methylase Trm11